MKSKTMDRWALQLQQNNIKFQHVAGKDNVVADAISHLKTANLYKEVKDIEVSKPKVHRQHHGKPNFRNITT